MENVATESEGPTSSGYRKNGATYFWLCISVIEDFCTLFTIISSHLSSLFNHRLTQHCHHDNGWSHHMSVNSSVGKRVSSPTVKVNRVNTVQPDLS